MDASSRQNETVMPSDASDGKANDCWERRPSVPSMAIRTRSTPIAKSIALARSNRSSNVHPTEVTTTNGRDVRRGVGEKAGPGSWQSSLLTAPRCPIGFRTADQDSSAPAKPGTASGPASKTVRAEDSSMWRPRATQVAPWWRPGAVPAATLSAPTIQVDGSPTRCTVASGSIVTTSPNRARWRVTWVASDTRGVSVIPRVEEAGAPVTGSGPLNC